MIRMKFDFRTYLVSLALIFFTWIFGFISVATKTLLVSWILPLVGTETMAMFLVVLITAIPGTILLNYLITGRLWDNRSKYIYLAVLTVLALMYMGIIAINSPLSEIIP
jgi:hypothetical protein